MASDKDRTMGGDDRLVRLEELKGFQVADDSSDIRGWDVKTPDGKKIGKVEELIVDPAERRVRYMEVKADRKALGIDDDRHILVPIGTARLNEKGNDVLIERLPAQGLAGAPAYKRGPITRDYETSLRNYYGATAIDSTGSNSGDYYRDDLYNDRGFRRQGAGEHGSTDRGSTDRGSTELSSMPRLGDNEVTVPLVGDQEVVLRRPGSDDEIVIRRNKVRGDEATN